MTATPNIDARIAELEGEGWQIVTRRNKTVEGAQLVAVKVIDDPEWPAWTLYLHESGFQVEPYAPDRSRWGGWSLTLFTDAARAVMPANRNGSWGLSFENLGYAAGHITKLVKTS